MRGRSGATMIDKMAALQTLLIEYRIDSLAFYHSTVAAPYNFGPQQICRSSPLGRRKTASIKRQHGNDWRFLPFELIQTGGV